MAAEVVGVGGGNAVILFASDVKAKDVAFGLTKKALQEAPGLRLILAHRPYAVGQLAATVKGLRDELAVKKRAPQHSAPLLGLGVTAACNFTGAPAVGIDSDNRYVSAEVAAKQGAGRPDGLGNERLLEYLSDIRGLNYEFIYDFNKLGDRDESSYLAVVHTDGNRMGERIGGVCRPK
ncbi:hypothetical protein [Candidatus Amarolinea dominans]|uniref:hypothetical protein n=1 Tax=Candidatus Amarolinea dominans TaxID=3140696 RepID=UPI0031CCB914